MINRRELKGERSPDDHEQGHYVLTPNTELQYNQINKEFEKMIGCQVRLVRLCCEPPPLLSVYCYNLKITITRLKFRLGFGLELFTLVKTLDCQRFMIDVALRHSDTSFGQRASHW